MFFLNYGFAYRKNSGDVVVNSLCEEYSDVYLRDVKLNWEFVNILHPNFVSCIFKCNLYQIYPASHELPIQPLSEWLSKCILGRFKAHAIFYTLICRFLRLMTT